MTTSELVFIPSPGAGHLPPTVELAKLLIHHDQQLSVTIIIMNPPNQAKHALEPLTSTHRLRFIDIPFEKSTKDFITPNNFLLDFIEYHKTHVRNIVNDIIKSDDFRLVGFVVDMFCVAMMDVANEFSAPTYIYFTSGAAMLGLTLYLQAKRDNEEFDVTEFKDSELEFPVPSYVNSVPAKVLPSVLLDKNGSSTMFLDLAIRFRKSKGIVVNTFKELESHGVESLLSSYSKLPPVFPVGPILNLKNPANGKTNEIMTWLNDQPECSVVFLCFGSNGSFGEEQVKQIAVAIERSGHKFLWSLRRPPSSNGELGGPEEYENFEEVLPKGFLDRTSNVGKVIGWAPQTTVLSHSSVGGFVSHCGWNSILESLWFGVPIAAWPVYAEQQLNAFQMVVDLGLAAEIKIDYRKGMNLSADLIENGIRKVMNDGEMRRKVKEMKEKSRLTVLKGGSSYTSIGCFIEHLTKIE
ncbi:UDP-glycosyltransferase 71E1-like [Rutidosis leptorrhynchoides]|uniref:UDP-glycosyltransferase 71E1-like n=1 Tax=Rutidosis leptorrhynchoides TaxID=125765 RepID=UPI003A99D8FA